MYDSDDEVDSDTCEVWCPKSTAGICFMVGATIAYVAAQLYVFVIFCITALFLCQVALVHTLRVGLQSPFIPVWIALAYICLYKHVTSKIQVKEHAEQE